MFGSKKSAKVNVCLLADHLDAVLAAGEDMIAIPPMAPARAGPKHRNAVTKAIDAQRELVGRARTLELVIVSRILQAREHAAALRRADPRFKLIGDLFVSSTHILVDAAGDLGDPTTVDFNTGSEAIGYLRSRGLIAPDAAGLGEGGTLTIGEDFKLAGVAPLGVLLDLVASFLDALDLAFELYEADAMSPSGGDGAAETSPLPA